MPGILAWENAAEGSGASITTTREAVGLGIRSVLTPQIADVWRSSGSAALAVIDIDVDLGASRSDLLLFLMAAPADGVLPTGIDSLYRIMASNVSVGGVEAMDTGALQMIAQPNGLVVHVPAAPVTARWVRFRQRPGAAMDYVQLGRIWCGPALITGTSAAYGLRRGFLDAGSNERAGVSGVRYATRGTVRRVAEWSFPLLKAADAAAAEVMARACGGTRQIFASPTLLAPAIDGILGTGTPRLTLTSFGRTAVDLSIEEDC